MVFDPMHFAPKCGTRAGRCQLRFHARSLRLVTYSLEDQSQFRPLPRDERKTAQQVGLRIRIDRDISDIAQPNAGLAKAIIDRFTWKAGPVFDAPEAFFLDSRDKPTVVHEASRSIAVIRIDTEDEGHGPLQFDDHRKTSARRSLTSPFKIE